MKPCSRCKVTKPESEFFRDRSRRDGLTAQCRACKQDLAARWVATESGRSSRRRSTKKWTEANQERATEMVAAWRLRNPDYSAEANRKWREANANARAEYHQANRDKARERNLRRRARVAAATVGPVDIAALWVANEGRCQLCGESIDPTLTYPDPMSRSVDHIVPLAKGGTHEQSNLQWTHLVENIRKGANVPASVTP